jgi:SpoU rRNA methylase family enzyme
MTQLKFYYLDQDGDIITVSNQSDLSEALNEVKPDRIIIADNVDQARESIGFSNMQRSSVLS